METFFGRKNEINKFSTAFAEVKKSGRINILVSGYPGEGKTALVNQFALSAEKKGAMFIHSKAYESYDSTPYTAITRALGIFIKKIIAENPSAIPKIKEQIQQKLGPSFAYALSLVPELNYLFEKKLRLDYSQDTEDVESKDSKEHSNILLLSLLEVFLDIKQPLILFLDDLQWLDTASYEFLQYLAINDSLENFMLVIAFRSNSEHGNNIFKKTLEKYRNQESSITIDLKGLTKNEIKRYLKNRFKNPQDLSPLSDACHQKTAGNPFYLIRLVDDLLEKGAIRKNETDWSYDISFISKLKFSENVADLIITKLKGLSNESILLLKHGSCMKEGISIELLQASSGFEPKKIDTLLWKPVQLNFLLKLDNHYLFSHDKILESVETLISDKEKILIHQKLKQFYLKKEHRGVLENDIFTLLHHYSFYSHTITKTETRKKMVDLYFRAGTRARRQSAYDLALSYYIAGKEHYPGDIWQDNYALALKFCNNAAKCAYLASDFSAAEKIFTEVETNTSSVADTLDIELVKIPCYQATKNPRKALASGLNSLKSLGLRLSANPSKLTILYAILKTWIRLIISRPASQKQKRMTKDSSEYYIVKIITAIGPSMFYLSPQKLLPVTLSIGLGYNLKYGNMEESSFYYILFGMILNDLTGSVKNGRKLRKMAREISREFSNDQLKGKEMFLATAFLDHWDTPILGTVTAFEAGEAFCLRHEEHDYYAYNAVFSLNCLFISGTPLKTVLQQFTIKEKILTRLGNKYALTSTGILALGIVNLLEGNQQPWIVEEKFVTEHLLEPMEKELLVDLHFYKFCIAFYCGRMDIAFEIKETLNQYIEEESGQPTYYYFHFLEALVDIYQGQNRKKIKKSLGKLKKYASYNSAVYKGKYLIASAEFLRVKGDLEESAKLYAESLPVSKKFESLFEEAFAYEKLGMIAEQKKEDVKARDYFQKAITLYNKWGLKWKYGLFDFRPKSTKKTENKNATAQQQNNSGELTRLKQETNDSTSAETINKTLRLMKEISNADIIHIAIKRFGKWKSIVNIKNNKINRPATFIELPEKILTFAGATEEILVANTENLIEQFFDTFYMQKYKPLSFIVIPNGKRMAIYIENHSESTQLETLKLLSNHIFSNINLNEFPEQKSSKNNKENLKELQEYCRKLQEYMKEKKSYQNMNLSLNSLAKESKISQRMITDSINTILNQNFHTFVNSYRIEQVKQDLRKPENNKKIILDIAFAAGFSSKSTFNDIFKKSVGTTPSKFRATDT